MAPLIHHNPQPAVRNYEPGRKLMVRFSPIVEVFAISYITFIARRKTWRHWPLWPFLNRFQLPPEP